MAAFLGPSYTYEFLCVCLKLYRLQLLIHYVHLGVTCGEYVAFHCSRTCGVPFKGELYTILCVDKALPVAVHSCVSH